MYAENISTLFFYLLTCSGLVELTNGLAEPLTLCETQNPVTVRELSGGTIRHVQRTAVEPVDECQLVLTGFRRRANIIIPGLVEKLRAYACPDSSSEMIINTFQYCVKASAEGSIVPLTDGTLTLKLVNQTVANFTLDYYSNVDACISRNSVITIPKNADYDQLSCIIASINRGTQLCSTVIKNLQDRALIVELLYTTSDNGEAATFNELNITKAYPRIFRNPGEELMIEQSVSFDYVLKLTVLTCGEVPQVQNTSSEPRNADSSTALWFTGSQVSYTCNEEGYEFRTASSVTCQLDSTNQSLEWSNISDIKCIPVECHVGDIRKSISNGEVSRKEIYRPLNNLSHRCKEGYVKSGSVICQADGNWSAEPQCVAKKQTVNRSPQKLEIIVGSTGGSIALLIAIITVMAIIITQRRRRSKLNQSITEIKKDTECVGQSEENTYFELEAPDVIRGRATGPAINQCGADLSAGPYEVVALERAGISTNKFQVEATTSAPSAETPTTNYTARQNESADVYAEVQAPKGHGQPSPPNLIRTPDPVYAEAPAVPAKLGEAGTPSPQPATDGVTMVDNSLHVSAAGGAYV